MSSATIMARNYAQALFQSVTKSPQSSNKYVDNLLSHLKKTGRMKLLPHIYGALLVSQKRARAREAIIEIAREEDRHAAVANATAALGLKDVRVVERPELLRGWRIRTKDMLVDSSAKNNLLQMYYHIINTQ
ncbi:MAG TPA: hypothetical protein ENI56_02740 [Candidatus Kaiserbacteria bacterium]|nr:hypothetical protein [Candidatus Kaiserbacteria bacterium]